MRIAIAVDPSAVRRWHALIRDRLAASAGADVRFRALPPGAALPAAVGALLVLERTVLHRHRDALFDRVAPAPDAFWPDDQAVDLTVNASGLGGPDTGDAATLRPLFDGRASEASLVAALLAGGMPRIDIADQGDRRSLIHGLPSAENGGGLTGGLDAVLSRTVTLVEALLSAPVRPAPAPTPARPPAPSRGGLASFLARALARDAARAAYRLCLFTPHWRVGWRRHGGPGVLERQDLAGPAWRVLADPGHRFFADPFPVSWRGRDAIFVEDLDHRVGKGVISVIPLGPEGPGAPLPVLEEPWHLSYPSLVVHGDDLYMVPEASLSGEVALYRCVAFPRRWERCATLLSGVEAADATLFEHGGRHWMTAVTRDGRGGYSDTLRIWHAPDLFGPWEEHGLRPVSVDVGSARPAGNVVLHGGRLWRPFQDCADGYGRALGLARIDRLDPDGFAETVVARLRPDPHWPGRRIHTLNRWGDLECIDGSAVMPRLPALRPWAAARLCPRAPDAAVADGRGPA